MWVQSFPISSFDYLFLAGSADFFDGHAMQKDKEPVRSEVIGQFCLRRTICYVGASEYAKSTDDGRRLALQLFSHHGILLRGPVFSIFRCCAQWRKIVESFCFVHRVFFFMAVVT